ncbi:hypothetical protein AVEN_12583-1 [Araneus ventricosus]|uniref:Uncharacterized protein n=1 Tax=Araneus ventricosus TaxID=182803 RepID=A0A4Y2AD59_ARAVE|nr:hypothetical protein AVEN_12583-1 [Araneus ventricosus]
MNTEDAGDEGTSLFMLEDLQMLSEIDSTLFGFLKFNKPEDAKKKSLMIKAVKCLEKCLVKNFLNKENDPSVVNQNNIENISDKIPVIRADDASQEESNSSNQTKSTKTKTLSKEEIHVRIFRKLGHFHLLLEDYAKETGPLTRSMDKQFEKLFAMMAEMKAGQEGLERKMEAGQEEMRVAQAGLEQKMEAGQEEMRSGQERMEKGQKEMKGLIDEVKGEV